MLSVEVTGAGGSNIGGITQYTYLPVGNLEPVTDQTGLFTSMTYDARKRVATTTTDGTVGPQPQVTLTYSYDLLDRRTGMEESLGGGTSYVWDAPGIG
ncbi:hypothetical protein [Ruegeria sp. A3M17]|uniref:hypothetical protein n=1 Tax=Ruegeria sp. A3M17 TaxID=2267229 RepID=UPI000DE89EAF|nr:hypothetical protein [Ruegeria sp. A3M17]RBW62534.1 hypothetical protein DS906_02450 [Ruegeria sp. A3M17]